MANLEGAFPLHPQNPRHTPKYLEVLSSERWLRLKEKILACVKCCEECGEVAERYDLHHIHYETLGHEAEDDVMVVCRPCHERLDEERAHEKAVRTYADKRFGKGHGYSWDFIERMFQSWMRKKDSDRREREFYGQ